ncbi:MAG TPA: SDR family oxidoreductase [Acidobacteriaceae bacterium]|nr:SDR family oxidoreductase [Acidobacteriaceae bacterium]
MPREIGDSVVVITGASSGIGRATALAFARRGAAVIAAARREQPLRELAHECERISGRALAVPTDVTDESAVRNLARRAIETFGRLDVWVNNAAVTLFGRLEETPYQSYRRVIETNLFGYVHGARAALPYFREQGSGVLINVASVVGKMGQPYTSAYVASKFGIVGLSECLRQEVTDAEDIHVCTVLPGSTDTPLFQQAANYTGRAVKPIPPVDDPDRVAEVIVRCAEQPEREVVVSGTGSRLILMHTLAPGWVERQIASKVEHEHFQEGPAVPTPGNLFEPMPHWARIRGGWQEPRGAAWGSMAAATGLMVLGFGLLAWWLRPGRTVRTGIEEPADRGRAVGQGAATGMQIEV